MFGQAMLAKIAYPLWKQALMGTFEIGVLLFVPFTLVNDPIRWYGVMRFTQIPVVLSSIVIGVLYLRSQRAGRMRWGGTLLFVYAAATAGTNFLCIIISNTHAPQ